jgi:adenylosuccinate lyase
VRIGMLREDAYALVQRAAMRVWDDIQHGRPGPSYREALEAEPEFRLCKEEVDAIFDPRGFLTRTGVIFERLDGLEF